MSSLTHDFGGRSRRFAPFGRLSNVEVQRAQTGVCASQESGSDPSSPEASIPLPDRDMLTSKKHLDELVKCPPPRSIWRSRSRRVSDLDSSRRSHDYTKDTSAADGDFATYLQRKFAGSSRKKRWAMAGFVVALFLVCVVAIVGAAVGTTRGDGYEEGAYDGDAYDGDAYELEVQEEGEPLPPSLPTDEYAPGPLEGAMEGPDEAEEELPEENTLFFDETEPTALNEDVDPSLEEAEEQPETSSSQVVPEESSSAVEESHTSDATPTVSEIIDELLQAFPEGIPHVPSASEEPIISVESPEPEPVPEVSEPPEEPPALEAPAEEDVEEELDPTANNLAPMVASPSEGTTTEALVPDEPEVPATAASIVASTITPDPSLISLRDSADTSIFKNRPAKSYDGGNYLTVKALEKASAFVMFDTSALSRNLVAKATLRVYSIVPDSFDEDGQAGGLSSVNVELLPSASDWGGTTVTYDSPLQSNDAFSVGSFSVEGYPYHNSALFNRLQRIHEVEVTRAFRHPNPSDNDIMTFALSSDEGPTGRVDFASREWNQGFAAPELTIELSDTVIPTIFVPPKTNPPPSRDPPTVIPATLSTTASAATTTPSVCENECIEGREKRFQKEFEKTHGVETISEWVDACMATSLDCDEDAKKCEKQCEKDAAKAEEKARKKADEHVLKCRAKCVEEEAAESWGAKAETSAFRPLAFMMWDP
ncbi:hypothetical protein ACHAXT_004866 [Thalassiosira profunda]